MKLSEIPKDVEFEGYYWLDNTHIPVVFKDKMVDLSKYETASPFIQEAFFTDKVTSYSVKHFDGLGHVVTSIKIDEIKENSVHSYLANPAIIREDNSIYNLAFIQEWAEEKDELCENLMVLKPGRIAFIGFNKEDSND